MESPLLRPWHVDAPGTDTDTDAGHECGWITFHLKQLGDDLDDLGFLTSSGVQRIRDACGDNYTARDLFRDVCARGWAWLA